MCGFKTTRKTQLARHLKYFHGAEKDVRMETVAIGATGKHLQMPVIHAPTKGEKKHLRTHHISWHDWNLLHTLQI